MVGVEDFEGVQAVDFLEDVVGEVESVEGPVVAELGPVVEVFIG